jgi:ribosome biogenesis protein BMS1
MDEKSNKPHRAKKVPKKPSTNVKAFAPNSGIKADRLARRKLDKQEKKFHVPKVDRTQGLPPPIIVAVVGPPKTGKTSLIHSLVKRYTKHNLNEIHGPVTVVCSKQRRITFIECNNDINSMVDIAKIADLVLLTIDASYGFEMETFEFLNILQTHGFPKVMGVLTHLDKFKDVKKLKVTKKRLKQRFWTEIYQGAKLFYLSGMINGKYLKNEILNLSRFISVVKFRPLTWRNTHSYILADRMEDLTNPEQVRQNPKCDRTITLYGYVRGTNLQTTTKVHIPGVGDHNISDISILADPCPIPDKARKMLNEQHKLLYAPMSDVGGILYDKDAIYVNIPGVYNKDNAEAGIGERLVTDLQEIDRTIEDKMKSSEMRLFNNSKIIKASDYQIEDESESEVDGNMLESDDEDDGSADEQEESEDEELISGGEDVYGRSRRRVAKDSVRDSETQEKNQYEYADTDSDLELDDNEFDDEQEEQVQDGSLAWKSSLIGKAQQTFKLRKTFNMFDFIYKTNKMQVNSDSDTSDNIEEDEQEDSLFKKKRPVIERKSLLNVDTCKTETPGHLLDEWESESVFLVDRRRWKMLHNSSKHSNPKKMTRRIRTKKRVTLKI